VPEIDALLTPTTVTLHLDYPSNLYPDVRGSHLAQTGTEWLKGNDEQPHRASMDPKKRPHRAAKGSSAVSRNETTAKKSPTQITNPISSASKTKSGIQSDVPLSTPPTEALVQSIPTPTSIAVSATPETSNLTASSTHTIAPATLPAPSAPLLSESSTPVPFSL